MNSQVVEEFDTDESARRAESLPFIADQIDRALDEQLSTADALDVKIGALFALAIGALLGYLALVASAVRHADEPLAIGTGLVVGYCVGCLLHSIGGLRPGTYDRWPDPIEFVSFVDANPMYRPADLAEQAARGKAAAHAWNKNELLWKSKRLGWTMAFLTGEVFAVLISAVYASTL